ncbi:MAG: hypothetical protein PHD66_09155 [Eubacteriales bacterium]|nr:hypothetical protein [Eubacteriales bacterium]
MKKSLLKDFYQGILAPADKSCLNNPKLLRLMDTVANSEEKLLALLEGGAKELFDTFSEAQDQIHVMTNQERYIDGFCTGMRLAMEALSDE